MAGFYANMGNYYSFGHMKFVPDLNSFDDFKKIILSHPDEKSKGFLTDVLNKVDREVMSMEKPYT